MADGTQLNQPDTLGDVISTDDITGGVADGQKAQRVKVGFGVDGSYADVSGTAGLPVAIQDQHTRPLGLRFVKALAVPTTLSVDTVIDARTITVTSATGFTDGNCVIIAESGDSFLATKQVGAPVGNVITLDSPVDRVYAAGAVVLPASCEMNVDGSVTPQTFQVASTGTTTEIDITRIMGYLQSSAAMDDSKFGSLPALTNGCVLRISDGVKTNIWNVKTNADLALLGFDFLYPEKPPAGKYTARFMITYAGQHKHGVTIRLAAGDVLEFIIQDDLTGLEVFNVMAQGHIVE